MPAHRRSKTATQSQLGSQAELVALALNRLEPEKLHGMQVEGVEIEPRLGELIDLLGEHRTRGRGVEAVTGFRLLFRDWARDGIGPRDSARLLFAVRDALRVQFEAEEEGSLAGALFRNELILDLMQAAYEEAMASYETELEESTAALEQVEQFPLDIAAMVDPETLARSAVSHFFDLTRARCVVLAEVDQLGRLTPVAGTPAGRALMRDFAPCLPEDCMQPVMRDGLIARSTLAMLNPNLRETGEESQEVFILPLRVRGKTTDVALLANSLTGSKFTEQTMRVAKHFASRVGVAMENARLHEAEQRKIDETMGLLELAHLTSSALDRRRMMKQASTLLADLCRVPACAIWLKDEAKERYYAAALSANGADLRGLNLIEEDIPGWQQLAMGESALLELKRAEVFGRRVTLRRMGVTHAMLYPLNVRGLCRGFIIFYTDGQPDGKRQPALMETAAGQLAIALDNASLYQDIERNYFCTVQALAKAIEVKDPYTHGHSERVTRFAVALGERLGLGETELRNLKYGATLHDIGKIGIAGRVLNKDTALDPEEYEHVKTHTLLGDSIIANVEFLQAPRPIIRHHHERFDGTGYPDNLRGEDIPLEARILAVADAFEAMLSRRPYRMPRSLLEARQELEDNAGTQFDPRIVEIFLDMVEENPGLLEKERRSRRSARIT